MRFWLIHDGKRLKTSPYRWVWFAWCDLCWCALVAREQATQGSAEFTEQAIVTCPTTLPFDQPADVVVLQAELREKRCLAASSVMNGLCTIMKKNSVRSKEFSTEYFGRILRKQSRLIQLVLNRKIPQRQGSYIKRTSPSTLGEIGKRDDDRLIFVQTAKDNPFLMFTACLRCHLSLIHELADVRWKDIEALSQTITNLKLTKKSFMQVVDRLICDNLLFYCDFTLVKSSV